MSDVVREYLRRQDYADHVVRGGLEGVVCRWERFVESVASGEPQEIDDYLNEMDGRRILEEALTVAPPDEQSLWLPRVRAADGSMRSHLIPTEECLWGEHNARKYGYTREHDWWYYHRPNQGIV